MAQSTNDTFPTAMRVATLLQIQETLPAMERLAQAFEEKGREFDGIVKSGRTHLQDATPIRLGQEFAAYGLTLRHDVKRLRHASETLYELNIGGTAVGTGLNAEPAYIEQRGAASGELTGFAAAHGGVAGGDRAGHGAVRGGVGRAAGAGDRPHQDRQRHPAAGVGAGDGLLRDRAAAVQPGSSIMPGKVNPSMAEMLNQVCFQVLGFDTTISYAAQAGQLELNVMMPVIIHNMLWSLHILGNAMDAFTTRCVAGIKANADVAEELRLQEREPGDGAGAVHRLRGRRRDRQEAGGREARHPRDRARVHRQGQSRSPRPTWTRS